MCMILKIAGFAMVGFGVFRSLGKLPTFSNALIDIVIILAGIGLAIIATKANKTVTTRKCHACGFMQKL